MSRLKRIAALSLCATIVAGIALPSLMRADGPATTQSARTADDILKDLQNVSEKVHDAMPSLPSITDDAFRKGDGQKAIPPLKQITTLLGELAAVMHDPETQGQIKSDRFRYMGLLSALGDADTTKSLEQFAAGKDDDAILAKSALAMAKWYQGSKDPAAQLKILDDYTAVAKANPDNEEVAVTLMMMSNLGAANDDVSKKTINVIRQNLKGDAAKQLVAQADALQAQQDMVGKPFGFSGRTSTGGAFNTADYKGKVVLIDFWATWCGPCKEGLPEVKKIYQDFHGKGLEIVGVSCDSGDEVLNAFIHDNDMPWIQLRESSQSDEDNWNPIAKKYGVTAIPAMFLIDKNGNLRFVDAREHLQDEIQKLITEDAKPATQPAH